MKHFGRSRLPTHDKNEAGTLLSVLSVVLALAWLAAAPACDGESSTHDVQEALVEGRWRLEVLPASKDNPDIMHIEVFHEGQRAWGHFCTPEWVCDRTVEGTYVDGTLTLSWEFEERDGSKQFARLVLDASTKPDTLHGMAYVFSDPDFTDLVLSAPAVATRAG